MISIHRAASRLVTQQPGVTTWHCFSSGSHYDPANVAFGALIAVDEHLVSPGAGFAPHRHRGVELVSWVLDGALHHVDASRASLIEPGAVQHQIAGSGIEHVEWNASEDEPLRFVQVWLLGTVGEATYAVAPPPIILASGGFSVHTDGTTSFTGRTHLFVARGSFMLGDAALDAGDSVRADEPVTVQGTGELMVLTLSGQASD